MTLLMLQYLSIDDWHFIFILAIDIPLEKTNADFQTIEVFLCF